MLNVRLNKDLEKKLKDYSQVNELSKTQIVKDALAMYFKQDEISQHPFELGEDLFGNVASDSTDRSTTYKQKLRKKLSAKHPH